MRFPTTFFFRLNSHQATIVVGVFEIVYYFASLLILSLFGLLLDNAENGALHYGVIRLELGDELAVHQLQTMLTLHKYSALLNIFFVACAIYAVMYKNRCLMLPWLVLEIVDLVDYLFLYIKYLDLAHGLPPAMPAKIMATFLYTAVAFTCIVASCYGFLAGIASYCELGVAGANHEDTANSELATRFQAIYDTIRGGRRA